MHILRAFGLILLSFLIWSSPIDVKAADEAKATLAKAQQGEQQAQTQANAAAQKLTEAQAQKKTADEALANVKAQVAGTKPLPTKKLRG